jgi:Capsule polysaccharide export protein
MQGKEFEARAYAALSDMRQRTSALLADVTGRPARPRPVWHRAVDAAVTALRIGRRWRVARLDRRFRHKADWLVLYSGRTPKLPGESDRFFFDRVTRSNRGRPLSELLGIQLGEQVLALEVRAGLNTEGDVESILDYVLSCLTLADLIRIIARAVRRPRDVTRVVSEYCIGLVSKRLAQRQTGVIMLTSNSLLAEIVRMAACGAQTTQVEVLHGIASVGMNAYYDFLEANSVPPPLYVNLIVGLKHFPSIQRHLLRDAGAEVAVNTHMWSRLGPEGVLKVPRALADTQPLVLVGGTSAARDYYHTSFFAAECRLLQMAREREPDLPIIYCPHPANPLSQDLVDLLARYDVTISPVPTFAMLMCAGSVVGTFSTSLFEAVLLGKRVFLLPFDHALLMPELLEDVDCARSDDSLAADFDHFLASLSKRLEPNALDRSRQAAQQALGVKLEFEDT